MKRSAPREKESLKGAATVSRLFGTLQGSLKRAVLYFPNVLGQIMEPRGPVIASNHEVP
jgi:hypothetical protein